MSVHLSFQLAITREQDSEELLRLRQGLIPDRWEHRAFFHLRTTAKDCFRLRCEPLLCALKVMASSIVSDSHFFELLFESSLQILLG